MIGKNPYGEQCDIKPFKIEVIDSVQLKVYIYPTSDKTLTMDEKT